MSSIQSLSSSTTHRICSGQVILSLSTALKELVENSLDAGAGSIEVRLVNSGAECIEIGDDGHGIKPVDFESLGLRHHTSKLRAFVDLEQVSTFGFRGEALSSLCNVADVTVSTRHASQALGTLLNFNKDGSVATRRSLARTIGTSVTVTNLFGDAPVRRREMLKNLRREFNKLVQVLFAYALVAKGTRIRCVNQTGTTKRTVVSTRGSAKISDLIVDVWGSKQLKELLEVDFEQDNLRIEGFISATDKGRASADRQLFSVNGRPCDLRRLTKSVNDLYRQYNASSRCPAFVLNLSLPQYSVDVNLTPDKRKVLLQQEAIVMEALTAAITQVFSAKIVPRQILQRSQFTCDEDSCRSMESSSSSSLLSQQSQQFQEQEDQKVLKDSNETNIGESQDFSLLQDSNQKYFMSSQEDLSDTEESSNKSQISSKFGLQSLRRRFGLNSDFGSDSEVYYSQPSAGFAKKSKLARSRPIACSQPSVKRFFSSKPRISSNGDAVLEKDDQVYTKEMDSLTLKLVEHKETCLEKCEDDSRITYSDEQSKATNSPSTFRTKVGVSSDEEILKSEPLAKVMESSIVKTVSPSSKESDMSPIVIVDDSVAPHPRLKVQVSFSHSRLKQQLSAERGRERNKIQLQRAFLSRIAPEDNKAAEAELQRELSQNDFVSMQLVGQFNLGFIVTRLNDDLFIVDQHAAHEKFNFERLLGQVEELFERQDLLKPQKLDCGPGQEAILREHLQLFRTNGFDFLFKNEQVFLTRVPHYRNCTLGKHDVDEMLFVLADDDDDTNNDKYVSRRWSNMSKLRPSRVHELLASRACRTSIMIGTSLDIKTMRRVVDNLANLEQPWNCPHGRPTLRHLIYIRPLYSNNK